MTELIDWTANLDPLPGDERIGIIKNEPSCELRPLTDAEMKELECCVKQQPGLKKLFFMPHSEMIDIRDLTQTKRTIYSTEHGIVERKSDGITRTVKF